MSTFVNALRSEATKMFSLRSTWVWAILMTGALYGPAFLIAAFSEGKIDADWETLGAGGLIFALVATSFCGSSIAADYSDKMFAHAFLSQDRRWQWLVARSLLILVFLAANALVGGALAWLVFVVMPKTTFVGGDFTQILESVLMMAIFGLIAIWFAVLTRSRVAAVAVPLVWMLVVEQFLGLLSNFTFGRYLWFATPGIRSSQLSGLICDSLEGKTIGWQADQIQPLWFNLAVILAWATVAIVTSLLVNSRRDVR